MHVIHKNIEIYVPRKFVWAQYVILLLYIA